jgi:hypothetical protein
MSPIMVDLPLPLPPTNAIVLCGGNAIDNPLYIFLPIYFTSS